MNRRTLLRMLGAATLLGPAIANPRRVGRATAAEVRPRAGQVPGVKSIPELLMPQPSQAAFTDAYVRLDSTWTIAVMDPPDGRTGDMGDRIAEHLVRLGGPRLPREALAKEQVFRRKIVLMVLGAAPPPAELLRATGAAQAVQLLGTKQSRLPSRAGGPEQRRGEAYYLSIEPERVIIAARDVEGVLLGGQTLMQLMTIGGLEKPGHLPHGQIVDWPQEALRGYLADVRKPPYRFVGSSLEGWKRHIDRLAGVKCNYLVFEQSLQFQYTFPGEPVGVPGGFRIETGRALSDYGYARGIILIPTVELSRGDSLRDYMARRSGRHPWMNDHRNSGFCPFNDLSYEFINRMLGELAAAFPYSPYLHVGEDETGEIGGSDVCPRCRQAVARYAADSGLAPEPAAYPMAYFQTRISELAKQHGRQTMVWGTYAFLDDKGVIRPMVPKVMTKDVIVWDWMNRRFDQLGYQTWEPYVPSWEWKGPGVRELVTHMVAFANKPGWDGHPNRTASGTETFARAWSLTTFGIDEPEIGRRCLSIFGHSPYGWAFDHPTSPSRWMRLRFGAYLCLKPEDFKDAKQRHASLTALVSDLQRFEEDASFFDQISQRVRLNQSLVEWYARGVRLSLYGLQYVQSLHRAHEAIREAAGDIPETHRRQLLGTAQQELESVLERLDGPIIAAVRLSEAELGGPILDSPTSPRGDQYPYYDISGVKNGIRAAVAALLKSIRQLSARRPSPAPDSIGLFPSVAKP